MIDPPSAPMQPHFFPKTLKSATLSWTPPNDSLCVSSYRIVVNNITKGNVLSPYNTITNTTSMTLSDLTQGADYSFTVAGVDAGGRVGEKSDLSNNVTLDSWSYKNLTSLVCICIHANLCTCVYTCKQRKVLWTQIRTFIQTYKH